MFQFVLWALVISLAVAKEDAFAIDGVLSPGTYFTDAGQQVFLAAGQNSNATSSVSFVRTYNNTPETWTWRVSIADIPIPSPVQDLGLPSANYSAGRHIRNTQYQLGFPTGGRNETLQMLLRDRNMSLEVNAFAVNVGKSAIDGFSNPSNGSCATILSASCIQSIQDATFASAGMRFDISGLQNCSSIFTRDSSGAIGFGVGPFNSSSPDSSGAPLYSGGALSYFDSESYSSTNQTLLDQAKGALNILVLKFTPLARSEGQSVNSDPSILCQVVDKSKVSAATGGLVPSSAVWAIMVLSLLASMIVA